MLSHSSIPLGHGLLAFCAILLVAHPSSSRPQFTPSSSVMPFSNSASTTNAHHLGRRSPMERHRLMLFHHRRSIVRENDEVSERNLGEQQNVDGSPLRSYGNSADQNSSLDDEKADAEQLWEEFVAQTAEEEVDEAARDLLEACGDGSEDNPASSSSNVTTGVSHNAGKDVVRNNPSTGKDNTKVQTVSLSTKPTDNQPVNTSPPASSLTEDQQQDEEKKAQEEEARKAKKHEEEEKAKEKENEKKAQEQEAAKKAQEQEAAKKAEEEKAAEQARKEQEAAEQARKDQEAKEAAEAKKKQDEAAAAQAKKDEEAKKQQDAQKVAGSNPATPPEKKNNGNGGGSYPPEHKGVHSGDATFYGTGLGACGITDSDSNPIVAVSKLLFDKYHAPDGNPNKSAICGLQIRATYRGQHVTVTVHDRCEGCAEFDLDFSPSAFSQIGNKDEGRLKGMTWEFV